jgi:rubrerythrin
MDRSIDDRRVEGGMTAEEFLNDHPRAADSTLHLLDLAISVEAQALDLYLRFARLVDSDGTRGAIHKIAEDEKAHLRTLGEMMGRKV